MLWRRFEDDLFATKEYRKMMLCDIPDEEMDAALKDEDFSEDGEESEEDGYDDEEEEEEEGDFEESDEDSPKNKKLKK